MHILNVHERRLAAAPDAVGGLLGTLASRDDRLWPGVPAGPRCVSTGRSPSVRAEATRRSGITSRRTFLGSPSGSSSTTRG
jgi:hypothetical protein